VSRLPGDGERGQGLVEFSIAITLFLALMMGVVDLGRAAYQLNGVTEAARELARAASVHPGSTLGGSDEVQATLDTQESLVPGLDPPTFACTDIAGAAVSGPCQPGDWVRVTITSTFIPVTPLATLLGQFELSGGASAKIE